MTRTVNGANVMGQLILSDVEFANKNLTTLREKFLQHMLGLVSWAKPKVFIEPHYPKPGKGRRRYSSSVMIRVHCMQFFYNLSDPGMEGPLYEIESMRRFASLRFSGLIPDEATILNFHH